MKKILTGIAVFAAAAAGVLAISNQTNAAQIIGINSSSVGEWIPEGGRFAWEPTSGVSLYKIYMYGPSIDSYELYETYSGTDTSVDIHAIIDAYCHEYYCTDTQVGEYAFAIVGYANNKAIAHSSELTAEKGPIPIKGDGSIEPSLGVNVSIRSLMTIQPGTSYDLTLDLNGGSAPAAFTGGAGYQGLMYFLPDRDNIIDDNSDTENDPFASSKVKAPSGKTLDAFEVNGVRMEPGEPFLMNADTSVRYLWKDLGSSSSDASDSTDTETTGGTSKDDGSNPNTLDKSPVFTVIVASCLAASAFALIRRSYQR